MIKWYIFPITILLIKKIKYILKKLPIIIFTVISLSHMKKNAFHLKKG